ncbi:MAG: hypothetical protein HY293_01870 [Planctomycetes bacterium]|nr:hypothetical protein [Planctomycetota bacterium]
MSRMHLELADSKTKYRPGETLEGVAFWELDAAPKTIEVRLYWQTQGKGTVDLEVVRTARFDGAGARDRRAFHLTIPPSPYSVSGTLVSIVWGVELVAEPKGDAANIEITVSPTGEEVRLDRTKPA